MWFPMKIRIVAISGKTGEREEITDNLYWFEENLIMSFEDEGYGGYTFEIYVNDVLLTPEIAAKLGSL